MAFQVVGSPEHQSCHSWAGRSRPSWVSWIRTSLVAPWRTSTWPWASSAATFLLPRATRRWRRTRSTCSTCTGWDRTPTPATRTCCCSRRPPPCGTSCCSTGRRAGEPSWRTPPQASTGTCPPSGRWRRTPGSISWQERGTMWTAPTLRPPRRWAWRRCGSAWERAWIELTQVLKQ